MIVKKEFVLKEVAGESIVVSTDSESVDFSGMLVLNSAGTFLFHALQKECSMDELVSEMLEKYNIDEKTARKDCLEFTEKLSKNHVLA